MQHILTILSTNNHVLKWLLTSIKYQLSLTMQTNYRNKWKMIPHPHTEYQTSVVFIQIYNNYSNSSQLRLIYWPHFHYRGDNLHRNNGINWLNNLAYNKNSDTIILVYFPETHDLYQLFKHRISLGVR